MTRIDTLLEFLKANPTDSFVQHALALEYIKVGDDANARDLFESLLERDPAYVGSYYHLARLLERTGQREQAINCYQKGMEAARAAGDRHSYQELQIAYDDLTE